MFKLDLNLGLNPWSVILLCPALCSIPIPHADKGIPAATAGDRRILIQFMLHAACTDGGGRAQKWDHRSRLSPL